MTDERAPDFLGPELARLHGEPSTNGADDPGDELIEFMEQEAEWPPTILPKEFWEGRSDLGLIRDWSIHKRVAPDAVLGMLISELILAAPAEVHRPGLGFAPMPLCYGNLLVARTGDGKRNAYNLSHDLLADENRDPLNGHVRRAGLGTGPGLLDELLMEIPDPDDPDGKRTIRVPHGEPTEFYDAEGRVVNKLVAARESTLAETVCKMVFGEALITQNATAGGRYRNVPGGTYRASVIVPCLPDYLPGVLSDVTGGLPQRMYFTVATAHHIPELRKDLPSMPTEKFEGVERQRLLVVKMPPLDKFTDEGGVLVVGASQDVLEEVEQMQLDHLHRKTDERASQAGVLHNTLACAMALLGSRATMTDGEPNEAGDISDWELARMMVSASDQIVHAELRRQRLDQLARDAAVQNEIVRTEVAKAEAVAGAVSDDLQEVVDWMVKKVSEARGEMNKRILRESTAGGTKKRRLFRDAVEHAVAVGLIEEAEGRTPSGQKSVSLRVVAE